MSADTGNVAQDLGHPQASIKPSPAITSPYDAVEGSSTGT
jgi:hypothetical protein